MFTGDARNTGDQFHLNWKPVTSCRWDAEGSWPHCSSGKEEEETEGGISTWCLGQGGRRLRGSDIWWVFPKAAAAFDLKPGLSVFVHEYYINMMFLQNLRVFAFPLSSPYSIFLCVCPSRILSQSKGLPWSPKYEESVTQHGWSSRLCSKMIPKTLPQQPPPWLLIPI